jgi:DNA integrity scanning protein DisA with diadenylate cyclase activity
MEQFRLLQPGFRDVIEVLIVAFVLYRVLLLIQGTRAVQMLIGIVVLVLVYAVAWITKLTMITYLLGLVFTYGAFAALIIFQPELRAGLAHLGQSRVTRFFRRMEEVEVGEEVAEAVERLARSGIGAIIVLEREVALGDYLQSGSEMQTARWSCVVTRSSAPGASCRCRRSPCRTGHSEPDIAPRSASARRPMLSSSSSRRRRPRSPWRWGDG